MHGQDKYTKNAPMKKRNREDVECQLLFLFARSDSPRKDAERDQHDRGDARGMPMASAKHDAAQCYQACHVCTAAWFSPVPRIACPRCESPVSGHDFVVPPWSRTASANVPQHDRPGKRDGRPRPSPETRRMSKPADVEGQLLFPFAEIEPCREPSGDRPSDNKESEGRHATRNVAVSEGEVSMRSEASSNAGTVR